MNELKKINSALISVYDKTGLEPIARLLNQLGIKIISTGGTKDFIDKLGIKTTAVEELTSFPEVLGGRVKTLHPKIFGGILSRRDHPKDRIEMAEHDIESIDLVIVDLYPFEQTLASGANDEEIIEKIDIGGISLIRAAAKNFNDVLIVSSVNDYEFLLQLLNEKKGSSSPGDRKLLAAKAFRTSSQYDTAIFNYFNLTQTGLPVYLSADMAGKDDKVFQASTSGSVSLRYGENPHQQGTFYGNLKDVFNQVSGKELSYNNLLDLDAALSLLDEFKEPTFLIIKHSNPCGAASGKNLSDAWTNALSADPLSAFGGVLVCNREIDLTVAGEINKLFFEVLLAPSFHPQAMELLKQKKNRILLEGKSFQKSDTQFRSLLNGVIEQDKDRALTTMAELKVVTETKPSDAEMQDFLFAEKIVKHAKSNAIVLVKNKKLIGIGAGLTSRVDALKHALFKAKEQSLNLQGAVMASDAFFPFPDCVEIACKEGIKAVIQPGGSVKDSESIEFCNKQGMAMVLTGIRHFKH